VPEALALYRAAQPLEARLRGLVRVSARRWDVVLDRDQRLMLPDTESVAALEQIIAIHEAHDLLERDVTHVDLRNPSRPTLRLAGDAHAHLLQIRAIEQGLVLGTKTHSAPGANTGTNTGANTGTTIGATAGVPVNR
jgi:cell division protein FtsQ